MGRHLGTAFAAVLADDVLRVDRQTTVRVDDDAEQSRVGLLTIRKQHALQLSVLCLLQPQMPSSSV